MATVALTLAGVLGASSASAQSGGWLFTDYGPIDGGFVGPVRPSQSAPSLAAAFLSQGGASTFVYTGSGVRDLGSFGDSNAGTFFANPSGQVAGQTAGATPGVNRAFLVSGASVTDLGTLGGTASYVAGINAYGQVAGYSDTSGNANTHAYLYSGGTLSDLGTLGGSYSAARGLNNAGAVVGDAYLTGDTASHAFVYSSGSLRDLGTLGGNTSFASAINTSGQIIGDSYLQGNSTSHAFFYSAGRMTDIGTLGGTRSSAIALNSAGQVIGNATLGGDAATHAFLYSGGRINDLGTLGGSNSFALGVNSLGQVIGLSDLAGDRGQHAFLYSAGRMIDLDNPFAGITGFVAAGINDAMQVVGYGLTTAGLKRAFVISPVPGAPGGICMLFGMAAIAAVARRRKNNAIPSAASVLRAHAQRVRVDVLGARIDVIDQQQSVALLLAWGEERSSRTVCACNVHSVVTARHDKSLANAIASADLAVADGAPIAWLMRKHGHGAQRRVCGPDLMWSYLEAAAGAGQSIFLYGSTEATLQRLRARIRESFPELVVAGMHAPPFGKVSAQEDRDIVDRINASGAATVWVALGCPKQEAWIAAHRGRIAAVMVGVGAAFDFHAGTLRRAPAWMRAIGVEWLHRLAREPRRLGRRYLVTNTIFVIATAGQFILGRLRQSPEWSSLIATRAAPSPLGISPQVVSG